MKELFKVFNLLVFIIIILFQNVSISNCRDRIYFYLLELVDAHDVNNYIRLVEHLRLVHVEFFSIQTSTSGYTPLRMYPPSLTV